MKKHLFLFVSIFGLAACATVQQQVDWTGQNFDDFIVKYGVPTSQHTLQNGNIAYSFVKPCAMVQAQQEMLVVVDRNNTISSVSRVSSCPSASDVKQYNEYVFSY